MAECPVPIGKIRKSCRHACAYDFCRKWLIYKHSRAVVKPQKVENSDVNDIRGKSNRAKFGYFMLDSHEHVDEGHGITLARGRYTTVSEPLSCGRFTPRF